jgi:Flp pilus assembly protein TadD
MKILLLVSILCLSVAALASKGTVKLFTTGMSSSSNSDPVQARSDAQQQAQNWASLACRGIVIDSEVIGFNYTSSGDADDGTLTYFYTVVVRDLCEVRER